MAANTKYDHRLGIDQFKQFLRKELIEKYNINKTSFTRFREELASMFRE